ncbi:MAG TPA: hypothetical protein P5555_04155 [Candidatus Paceibacterota bacterium]|nr:hypothetical protein [Verrucomicrobiota bacterium]HRZ44364.1 hypothetical protein [Candidatus Paceibacterota bacterium]HRZ94778.1 hypothetical protein [Candidatus Paceibacterota bacterium]
MKSHASRIAGLLVCLAAAWSWDAGGGPYVNGQFQGRIAYSADGNHNDPDDWIASPVALAIFAASGLKDRLVHFDYNCILPLTDPEWEKKHAESVLGAAERYGYDRSLLFDCRRDLDGAAASLARAIDQSTPDNPLYLIIAGPMEMPYLAIERSKPARRAFVYCISHSRWNDGYASGYRFNRTKRDVIRQNVRWVQIRDQNRLLSFGRFGQRAAPGEFAPYFWMRDSGDAKVRWLWERMVVSTRPDPSDAGMAWFLATGDEECDPGKLKGLLDGGTAAAPIPARQRVRLEAENFHRIEGFQVDDRDREASHRLNVRLEEAAGRIRMRFDEPYVRLAGRYDVEIRHRGGRVGGGLLMLRMGGAQQGEAWRTAAADAGWQSHAVADVAIGVGDELAVEAEAAGGGQLQIDYVEIKIR